MIQYASNEFSQNGEDGILAEIFRRMEVSGGSCCEFGAWDGKYLSNTFNLVKNHGWEALYIEADSKKFLDLLKTQTEFPDQITVLNERVGNNLDDLIHRADLPLNFDLLSIDIDSYDYQAWESLVFHDPKVVVVEVNSSLLPGRVRISNPKRRQRGSSFTSMLELGKRKGYDLICHTGNMIFVDRQYSHLFSDVETNSDKLFITRFL